MVPDSSPPTDAVDQEVRYVAGVCLAGKTFDVLFSEDPAVFSLVRIRQIQAVKAPGTSLSERKSVVPDATLILLLAYLLT